MGTKQSNRAGSLLGEQAIVSDGYTTVVLNMRDAWANETIALMWRIVKLLIELDRARAEPGNRSARSIAAEIEHNASAWLIRSGI